MRGPSALAALAALTAALAAVPAEAQRRAPAARAAPARVDWVRQAVRTPEGGVRIGNPAAPVKLVEYGSITCPHCAHFAHEATQPLYAYVRSGRVSWEYRPYMIFPTDPGLFALLNCQGPAAFFRTVEQLYSTQRIWATRVQTWLEANQSRVQAMSLPQRSVALFRVARIEGYFRANGMTAPQVNACIGNPANLQRVADVTQRAIDRHEIPGTPTFYVNGVIATDVGVWADLEPVLLRAGARGR